MSLVINTNLSSLNAQFALSNNTAALQKDYQELSSGYRINSAADDAAGLQISNNLEAQINGVNQAVSNAQEGSSLLSIAEGTLDTVNDHLQRIRELTVEAANDTNSATQRQAINQEITARMADINRITKGTQFNGKDLLTSSVGSVRLQVGANGVLSLDTINIGSALGSATATGLGITTSLGSTASSARAFLAGVDAALTAIGSRLAAIGATQNRLTAAISNLTTTSQNYQASDSTIRDVDVASASADLSKNQILQQAAASVLSQANQSGQIALKLITGQ